MRNLYLLKAYDDSLAYGEEYTRIHTTREAAREELRQLVEADFGVSLENLKMKSAEGDFIEPDYVSIGTGRGTSYYVIEEHCVEEPEKIRISLGNGQFLIAEPGTDDRFKEIFIGTEDSNGDYLQDLAVVREEFRHGDDENIVPVHGKYQVIFYPEPGQVTFREIKEVR